MKTWSIPFFILVRAAPVALFACLSLACSPPDHPSLLLVTIDTLRADHLSSYGYSRPTSPAIDRLARRGVLFDSVISSIPETGPAFASLMTGLWPSRLGLRGNGKPLAPRFETLAERLRSTGYHTAAFVSGYPLVRRLSGLDQGFAHYDDRMPDPRGKVAGVQRLAEKTTAAFLAWLQQNRKGPFFVWLHYYDPHGNYAPGRAFESMFTGGPPGPNIPLDLIPAYQRWQGETDAALFRARYDGEIRRVDAQIERVLAALGARDRLDSTLVVLTADHGESLVEHGYYFDHGNELYMPSLHVPLILAGPGVPADGRHVAGLARTPDIMPTLLELLHEPVPDSLAGTSLAADLRTGRPSQSREAFSEARFQAYRPLTPAADVGPKLSVRGERFSTILRLNGGEVELYDRHADPLELSDLLALSTPSSETRELRETLSARLRARLARATRGGQPDEPVFSPYVVWRAKRLATLETRP
ncbi:MAG: sulfatase [Acidobacteriota bacterium]